MLANLATLGGGLSIFSNNSGVKAKRASSLSMCVFARPDPLGKLWQHRIRPAFACCVHSRTIGTRRAQYKSNSAKRTLDSFAPELLHETSRMVEE